MGAVTPCAWILGAVIIAAGLMEHDYIELESRAFESQAKVTRAFWPDELPNGSDWE